MAKATLNALKNKVVLIKSHPDLSLYCLCHNAMHEEKGTGRHVKVMDSPPPRSKMRMFRFSVSYFGPCCLLHCRGVTAGCSRSTSTADQLNIPPPRKKVFLANSVPTPSHFFEDFTLEKKCLRFTKDMANRGPSYGLSAQVANKLAGKRDPQLEAEVLQWIEAIMGQKLPAGPYEEVLRDGTILCNLMNILMPGCIAKINTAGGQFKMMENINRFQEAAKKWGVPEIDVFQTVDLWERRNIPQVTQCLMALGRACYQHPDYNGPSLGPRPSEENKRQFTEEQLRASEGIINLQYGTNKGATQAGQNFGNTRHM